MKSKQLMGVITLIFIFFFFLASSPFAIVGPGERGVKVRFGSVSSEPLNEGIHFKIPFIETVRIMDVKIQKREVEARAASKDLQTVTSIIALNYRIIPESTAKIYQEIGIDYEYRVIDPSIQEAVKSSTAKFTAEELITKREEVRDAIKAALSNKFKDRGIEVVDFNIVSFQFSTSFDAAIELKVTAEQEALAAQNRLEQIQFEAQQKIEAAKGTAEAITIESEALKSNPEILELKAIEKWNGELPNVVSGDTVPFIQVK